MNRQWNDPLAAWVHVGAGAAAMLFANIPALVWILIGLQAMDLLTGMLAAGLRAEMASDVAWRGIGKKVMALLILVSTGLIGLALESLTAFPAVALVQAVAGFYAAHEGLSILENASRAGLPVPEVLKGALARLSPEETGGRG